MGRNLYGAGGIALYAVKKVVGVRGGGKVRIKVKMDQRQFCI